MDQRGGQLTIHSGTESRAGSIKATDRSAYVINLFSSVAPIAELPDLPIPDRYQFYKTRRTEEGQERYRLHLGFFASEAEATKVLPFVRQNYPTAWVVKASDNDLRHAKTPLHEPQEQPKARRKVRAKTGGKAAGGAPAKKGAQGVYASSECYVVQLGWWKQPIDRRTLPSLAIFDSYRLYSVKTRLQQYELHGLRLGFFRERAAAEQVAGYVSDTFRSAAAVVVSKAERVLATSANDPIATDFVVTAKSRIPQTARVKRAARPSAAKRRQPTTQTTTRSVMDRVKAAPKVGVETGHYTKLPPREEPKTPFVGNRGEKRLVTEILEEEPELNASGVRHVYIKVERPSVASRLLSRLSRRERRKRRR